MRSKLVYELEAINKTYWIILNSENKYRVYEYSHTVGDVNAVQDSGADISFENKDDAINFINKLLN